MLQTNRAITAVRPVTLREQVYEKIRQAILDRQLTPGDHVREQGLTKMLAVSRTPLREALGLLERDGLLRNFPNRGWFVATFTPTEIEEIFVMRAGLESLAAELMIDRMGDKEFAYLEQLLEEQGRSIGADEGVTKKLLDMKFHRAIVELAGNQRLVQMWENIYIQCAMAFHFQTVTMPDYDHTQAVRDHTAILDALRSGDLANVRAVNNDINMRVAKQCIAGTLAPEQDKV